MRTGSFVQIMEPDPQDAADSVPEETGAAPRITSTRDLLALSLGALGVVYGDLGTSPLYTIKECFNPPRRDARRSRTSWAFCR